MRVRPLLVLTALGLTASALVQPASAADPTYTVQTLHFAVRTGAANNVPCDVVGDLYVPNSATASKRVPAILTTNGFGGSKNDQAGLGKAFASRGYVVLSYSGLGFGGSGCKITLDDPDTDGKAASQLVSYLGGKTGIAFTDAGHTVPAPALTVVQRDTRDHAGNASTNDPRLGMIGVSYGGGAQFAAASLDMRIDTLIPGATWNDLSYSLSPNNTAQTSGVSTANPGAAKLVWALGFAGLGIANGLQNVASDPSRIVGCPNFATFVCPALVSAGVTGFVDQTTTAKLRHASVGSYVSKIKIPTLLIQGQDDTLFNLNESVATYQALKKQGVPTKLVWVNGGHSGPMAPGEIDFGNPNPATQHISKRAIEWFDHYLKGSSVSTGPEFTYFRDWVSYDPAGSAAAAYATSTSFPVGTATKYYLSAGKQLVTSTAAIKPDTQSFLTLAAGLPSTIDPFDVLAGYVKGLPAIEQDLPGTFASWTTPALTKNTDVVGSPVANLQVSAPTSALTQATGPTGQLVVFVKVLDVDAAGKATLVRNLVAPVRVLDVTKPFKVTLPGFVHRFAAGHKIQLVVAGGSVNYRGGVLPTAVSIAAGSTGQTLTLPIVN
ncbi:hypothetical protein GCM10022234_18370 [Aeromicrobium panaciterrae]|uniref:CocE/NonD family hydrolase n=1 Tax=Aeromicrobium panaciterrae TaxID=363861 RepID=UPI0031DDE94B